MTVCLDPECPVHHPQAATQRPADPPPVMEPAPERRTDEETAQRQAEHEQRMAEYEAEQKRKEEERKAEWERQQKEYEAEQARHEKQQKARQATFERIIEQAPATFSPAQLRVLLRLLVHLDHSFLEEVAAHFASGNENTQQSDEEIVLAALDRAANEKLTGLALRIVLSDHIDTPHENQPDFLVEAERAFAPGKPTSAKPKAKAAKQAKIPSAKRMAKQGFNLEKSRLVHIRVQSPVPRGFSFSLLQAPVPCRAALDD